MVVGKLTLAQKNLIIDKDFDIDMKFNPFQDADDNWCISIEEINQYKRKKYNWVKDIPLIEYNPKINNRIFN